MEVEVRPGQAFAEDVHNEILETCSDAFDAILRLVRNVMSGNAGDEEGAASPLTDSDELARVQEGIAAVHAVHMRLGAASLDLFQEICSTTVFRPPVTASALQLGEVALPDDGGCSSSGVDAEGREQLAAQVASLRQELSQVDGQCGQLHEELGRLDRQLAECADADQYAALASNARSSKQTLVEIVECSHRLQQYMEQANRLRLSLKLPEAQRGTVDVEDLDTTNNGSIAMALELFGCPAQPAEET